MSAKAVPLVLLDDAVSNLRSTLAKHKETVPPAMARLVCKLLSDWGRHRLKGNRHIHPGRERMAEWAGCSERHAQRLVQTLVAWNVLERADHVRGGAHAVRYHFDTESLRRVLILLGCNPSPELLKKLRLPVVRGDMRGDMRGDIRGDTMSPDLKVDTGQPEILAKGSDLDGEAH